ncbi:vanadium-dependent haloperoxidase [Streptomyces collinus]|uniref:vanadium-dependent haloperoxidase n=1 Tax=Streptomyces collinus TaxID=42684 RepID=UPI0038185513
MAISRKFWGSRIRYCTALGCAFLTVLGASGYAVVEQQSNSAAASEIDFDWDAGNAPNELIYPRLGDPIKKLVSSTGMDATLITRVGAMVETGWFDAVAPYHPTAKGIYSDLGRRPASERATNRNINIALVYATYRMLHAMLHELRPELRELMTAVGLDPDDNQENTTTPVGLGNLAAKGVLARRLHDGLNQLGDEGGRTYNRQPYADTTGYQPVNTPEKIRNPSRWQPSIENNGHGIFRAQQFVTPQMKDTKPIVLKDPDKLLAPPPINSDYQHNPAGYKRQANQILAASAGLTEERKLKAEFFNDKFLGLGHVAQTAIGGKAENLLDFVFRFASADIAHFDTLIPVWKSKYRYDTVRPFTAIHYLYGDRKVTAWGGPGKGTVTDLPGNQWTSYVPVSDHPEYPSGSTALCAALAQLGRRWDNTDKTTITYTFPKGSSKVEPGLTPTTDRTLRWNAWTDYTRDCAQARVDGGVHFPAAVAASQKIGPPIADLVFDFLQQHIQGKTGPKD